MHTTLMTELLQYDRMNSQEAYDGRQRGGYGRQGKRFLNHLYIYIYENVSYCICIYNSSSLLVYIQRPRTQRRHHPRPGRYRSRRRASLPVFAPRIPDARFRAPIRAATAWCAWGMDTIRSAFLWIGSTTPTSNSNSKSSRETPLRQIGSIAVVAREIVRRRD